VPDLSAVTGSIKIVAKQMPRQDKNRFLFGSDSSWGNQEAQVKFIDTLKTLNDDYKESIFHRNVGFL
jgi:hypothetical protein